MKPFNQNKINKTVGKLYDRFFSLDTKDDEKIDYEEELKNPYFKMLPEAVHVFNLITKKLVYISPNYKDVTDWTAEEMAKGGSEFMLSLIHPDHAKIYNDHILLSMFRQFSAHTISNDVSSIKFVVTMKYKNSVGEFFWMRNSIMVLKTKLKFIPVTMVSYLNNIDHFKQDEAITLTTIKKDERGNFKAVKSQRFYNFDTKVSLTKNELSVLYLLKTNNSTDEIAQELHLSKRTVYNYRNSLLKKMQVNNVHQLITVSESNGLI